MFVFSINHIGQWFQPVGRDPFWVKLALKLGRESLLFKIKIKFHMNAIYFQTIIIKYFNY